MFFASPLWLLALIPWSAATLWLLWGRRPKTPVPFLDLWRGPALQRPAKRALQPPPIYLAFALLGMLAALLAAAGPAIHTHRAGKGITIIVDCGMSMSASNPPRFVVAGENAGEKLSPTLSSATPVELLTLPGNEIRSITLGQLAGELRAITPTAIDTQSHIDPAVRDRLLNTNGAVVLISDQSSSISDPRLIQFAPMTRIDNVGIVSLAARQTPSSQVMVRLRNDSDRQTVSLRVESGVDHVERVVDLPPRGDEANFFVDLPRLAEVIEASIDSHDELPADDRAALVRQGGNPRIEQHGALSPELRRMIDVYSKSRLPSANPTVIAVVNAENELPSNAPAIIIANSSWKVVSGSVVATAHPVTANINWNALADSIKSLADAPRGWKPIVTVGDRVIVAIREEPVRQIWVGFDSPTWPTTTDFVVFWANVFDWLAQSRQNFVAEELSGWNNGWKMDRPLADQHRADGLWPGIYRTSEGSIRAFNTPAIPLNNSAADTADWKARLTKAQGIGGGIYSFGTIIIIIAIACLTAAALAWKRLP